MPLDINVVIDASRSDVALSESALINVVQTALSFRSVDSGSVSVVVADHSVVRELNRTYLNHDYNTDVLSFLLSDSEQSLDGEVYVDLETAIERCSEFSVSPIAELYRYIIHGVLHLTGMDDATDEQRSEMADVEDRILDLIPIE